RSSAALMRTSARPRLSLHPTTFGTSMPPPRRSPSKGTVTHKLRLSVRSARDARPPDKFMVALASSGRRQREAFVQPARPPADHHLNRQPKTRQPNGGFVGAVAVRSGAVHNEDLAFWILRHALGCDLSVRYVDSALHMPIGKDLGSPDIGEDEVEIGRLEALVHVPTVRLKSEHVLEVAKRSIRWRCRRFGDVGRHVLPPWLRGRDNALRPYGT